MPFLVKFHSKTLTTEPDFRTCLTLNSSFFPRLVFVLTCGNDKTGKGLSANTVNAIISVLQNSLRTVHLLGYVKDYTANMIKRPKLKERKIECFTLAEQKKIESAVFDSKRQKCSVSFYAFIRACV